MSIAQVVATVALVLLLGGLGVVFTWRQFRALRQLRDDHETPPEEQQHFRKQAKRRLASAILLLLMAIKFAMVAWFFMHLKWDKPILWRVFLSGILLAFAVYIAVMFMFRLFGSDSMV